MYSAGLRVLHGHSLTMTRLWAGSITGYAQSTHPRKRDACRLPCFGTPMAMPKTIHENLIRLAFSTKASLAMAPMQDYLGLGSMARMNTPGTTNNNWRWRLRNEQVNPHLYEWVRHAVTESGRGQDVTMMARRHKDSVAVRMPARNSR